MDLQRALTAHSVKVGESRRNICAVLLDARALLLRDGWARGLFPVDAHGNPRARLEGEPWTLVDALLQQPEENMVPCWDARMLLKKLAGESLCTWNAHPHRTPDEVLALLDAGIRKCGVEPPRTRYREPQLRLRRGPFVSVGPGGKEWR